jgi:membrane protein required for beta-lactamase induction
MFISAIFMWLPVVDKLPTIGGFDIDGALATGVAELHGIMHVFWLLQDIFFGFVALLTFYAVKMGIVFFLGHRAPSGK